MAKLLNLIRSPIVRRAVPHTFVFSQSRSCVRLFTSALYQSRNRRKYPAVLLFGVKNERDYWPFAIVGDTGVRGQPTFINLQNCMWTVNRARQLLSLREAAAAALVYGTQLPFRRKWKSFAISYWPQSHFSSLLLPRDAIGEMKFTSRSPSRTSRSGRHLRSGHIVATKLN